MNLSEEAPKLPVLPFLVGDAALLGTALLIGRYAPAPIGPWPLLAIALCVIAGAALSAIPFIVNYARHQDAALDERQNQIAALARTTADSAEQLSIAASGLHVIAETSAANLKLIEQLPAQLQEQLKTLQKQLAASTDSAAAATAKAASPVPEKSPRLDEAAARITQAVADLAKLEAATRQHLAAVNDTVARLPARTDEAAAQAARQLSEITALATTAFLEAKTRALVDFEQQLTAATTRVLAAAQTHIPPPPAPEAPRRKSPRPAPVETTPAPPVAASASEPAPAPESAAPSIPTPVPPEPIPEPTPPPEPPAAPAPESPAAPVPVLTPEPEPAPALAETPHSLPAEPAPEDIPVSEPPKPRPRAPKPAPDPGFDLGLSVETPEAESALSSDGFTRLIATAYIGIGNKLFIRGEGPGLSWDKGVPLQFVSIGKWRWETADATAPVRAKLYKNDQTECVSVGTLTLEPGHQHDINAGF